MLPVISLVSALKETLTALSTVPFVPALIASTNTCSAAIFTLYRISLRVKVLPSSPLKVTFPALAVISATSWSAVRFLTSSIFSSISDTTEHFDRSRFTILYLLLVVVETALTGTVKFFRTSLWGFNASVSTLRVYSPVFVAPVNDALFLIAAEMSIFVLSFAFTRKVTSDFPNFWLVPVNWTDVVFIAASRLLAVIANGLIWYVAEAVVALYPYASVVASYVPSNVPITVIFFPVTFVKSLDASL